MREDNIKIDFKKIMWDGVNWMNFFQYYEPVKGSYEHGSEQSFSTN
jgi:hypothetical protein